MSKSFFQCYWIAVGALMASVGANVIAADNTPLYTCETNDKSIVQYFYKPTTTASFSDRIKTFRMQIGQDLTPQAPLHEVDMWLLDDAGAALGNKLPPLKRIAFVQDASGDNTSITYSPTRSTGAQNARPFHLLIDETGAGRLSFIQVNAGRNASGAKNFSLSCTATDATVQVPVPVSLVGMGDAEQVKLINALAKKRPSRGSYAERGRPLTLPSDVVAGAETTIKDIIKNLELTEEFIRRETYSREGVIERLPSSGRCSNLAIGSIRSIRDYSGATVAYRVTAACREPALKITRTFVRDNDDGTTRNEVQRTSYAVTVQNVLLTPNAVLSSGIRFDLGRVDDADEE